MLRSLENLEFLVSHANRLEIQMSAQGEMIEFSFDLQAFQFEERIQRSKDVIVLGCHAADGRFA